jgi:hypothetical protein
MTGAIRTPAGSLRMVAQSGCRISRQSPTISLAVCNVFRIVTVDWPISRL